jgi:tetratricopeptide (TPR) repeat protein
VSADPGSASAQYTLGLAAAARRDYDRAEAAFAQTLNLNPNAVSADLALAKLRLARGDSASALNAAEDAVSASPDDPAAVFVLARSLRAQGDLDRARRELTTRLDKAPDAPELEPLWTELAHVELSANQPGAAQSAFDRAHAITPSDPALDTLAAQIEIASHDTATAETQLLDIVRRDPGRLDAYELLAALYVQQGNAAAALDKYRVIAARAPDQSGPATMIGILLEAAHDPAGARAQYEAVLARDPKAGVAANNLAWMLAQDGQYDQALRWAQASTDSLRARPEPLDTLGWVRLKLNQPTEALAAFEKALSVAPGNATYQEHARLARAVVSRQ